jgi:hypothetical protein
MASTNSGYGLRAVNELGGLPYAGSTRQFLINPDGSTNTNIFNGSIVAVDTSGYIVIVGTVGSSAGNIFPAGTIGVFVGCSYVNAQGQVIYSQYYPASYVAPTGTAITAYVIDDDRAVFQVQANGSLTQTALGMNAILSTAQTTSTGSTTTGNSNTQISTSLASTATYAFKIVGFVNMQGFSVVGDAYTDVLVKFNVGSHAYNTALGVA